MSCSPKNGRKTIIITLSNRAVWRNLFFSPKGVFGELLSLASRVPNIEIVVLTEKKDFEKYKNQLAKNFNGFENVVSANAPSPKGRMLGKLFYFFYSYLIYTDTTKLLATMGTRPDEPPAGGNRALSFFKWIVSVTFGKIAAVKLKLVPFLFFKIFKERPFKEILEKYKPQVVFTSHLYDWFDQELLAECKRQGIFTFGMAAGWDHLDKYYLPLHADKLLVQSEEMLSNAKKYQLYKDKETEIVGYPHFDFLTDQKFVLPEEEVLSRLSMPKDANYLLYVSGSAYCPDEPQIIEKIISWIEEEKFGKDMYLVIRPYLGGRGKDKEFDQKKYLRFADNPKVRFYGEDFWNDFAEGVHFTNIIRRARVVLAIFTTMALEAVVMDRPILAIGFDGYIKRPRHRSIRRFELFLHFQHVRETGAMPTAYSFEELFSFIKKYLENEGLLKEERKIMRERMCYKLDGGASARVVKQIWQELKKTGQ
ncbi:MAG: hypothetical protein Q8P52_00730 [bacterium]|nr:hypothetical protein [bacterium]